MKLEIKNKSRTIIIIIVAIIILTGLVIIANTYRNYYNSSVLVKDRNLGKNIYKTQITRTNVYDINKQNQIDSEISKKFTTKNTFYNPLIIYNAYGTNLLSANIYFYTDVPTKISYEIETNNTEKFTRNLYNENEYTKKHEYQIIGLVAGEENRVKIISSSKEGENQENSFSIKIPQMEQPQIDVLENNGQTNNDGLFALLGCLKEEMVEDVFLIDNKGVIRGRITLPNNDTYSEMDNITADDLIVYENNLYYNIASNKIAKVNRLGQVEDIFVFDGYNKHHDFKIDKDKGKILLLTSKNNSETIEDCISIYDINSNKLERTIDLKEVLSDIFNTKYNYERIDWIHVNSIDIKNDEIIISSRELSAIICITEIYTNPTVKYILGIKEMFEGTEFEDLVYTQENKFDIHLGQHTAFYTMENGKECIGLYNNNLGYSYAVNWIDWVKYKNEKENSYFYLYELNHNEKTFKLINSIELPYSAYMSSSQYFNNNVINSSREAHYFGEYTKNGDIVRSFKVNEYVYRIYKYSFLDFWFTT